MSKSVVMDVSKGVPADVIEQFITHDDPAIRAAGRLIATSIPADIYQYVRSEQNMGTPANLITNALVKMFGQIIGGVIMQMAKPGRRTQVASDCQAEFYESMHTMMADLAKEAMEAKGQ